MSAVRLMIVDDHPVVREGLVAIFETTEAFEVVAEASGGREAISRLAEASPDVVLLDLEMPDGDGIEAIRGMRAADPDVRIIVFTAYDTDELIVDAVRAGIEGYMLKGVARRELFDAIRVVHEGGTLLQPAITTKLLARMGAPEADPASELTQRELEVLGLLAKGLPNREIGEALHITERTVKFHVSSLLDKLDVQNRTEAVSRAIQLGLVDI